MVYHGESETEMDDVATLPFKETPVCRGSIGNFLVAAGVFSEGQWFAVVSAESVCLISFRDPRFVSSKKQLPNRPTGSQVISGSRGRLFQDENCREGQLMVPYTAFSIPTYG